MKLKFYGTGGGQGIPGLFVPAAYVNMRESTKEKIFVHAPRQ